MISDSSSTNDAWRDFHRRWSQLRPPLRPDSDVVSTLSSLVAGRDQRLLLLGVTPELAVLGQELTAVDWSAEMVARIWPGDGASRRAVTADWRDLPMFSSPFSAAIGDGSLNTLLWPQDYERLFISLAGVLSPGGRVAIRCYLAPDIAEPVDHIVRDVKAGRTGFHALKWRLAMLLARENASPNLAVKAIHRLFESLFPDRTDLAQWTGWSGETIAEIDAYRHSPAIYSFPTAGQLLSIVRGMTNPRLVPAGSYELAQCCPIFTADLPA